jgi:hypothetical protein
MRRITILLLIVLAVTVVAPLSFFSIIVSEKNGEVLSNLDVCNGATPALSAHGEMPCVTTSFCADAPLLSESANESLPKIFIELILSSRSEQPPRS